MAAHVRSIICMHVIKSMNVIIIGKIQIVNGTAESLSADLMQLKTVLNIARLALPWSF